VGTAAGAFLLKESLLPDEAAGVTLRVPNFGEFLFHVVGE
jgi:hypothetical protein